MLWILESSILSKAKVSSLSSVNLFFLTEIERNDSRYLQGGPSRLSDRWYNRNKAGHVRVVSGGVVARDPRGTSSWTAPKGMLFSTSLLGSLILPPPPRSPQEAVRWETLGTRFDFGKQATHRYLIFLGVSPRLFIVKLQLGQWSDYNKQLLYNLEGITRFLPLRDMVSFKILQSLQKVGEDINDETFGTSRQFWKYLEYFEKSYETPFRLSGNIRRIFGDIHKMV